MGDKTGKSRRGVINWVIDATEVVARSISRSIEVLNGRDTWTDGFPSNRADPRSSVRGKRELPNSHVAETEREAAARRLREAAANEDARGRT